jgi:dynein heavy chain
LADADLLEILS